MCLRFLDQQDQIESSTEEVLSGSVRSIVGQLTVTEIITNRSALQGQVLEAVREAGAVRAVVVVTSDKCYDNREQQRPFVEDDPMGGHDIGWMWQELGVEPFRR
mgnify:CR=1 FL=1